MPASTHNYDVKITHFHSKTGRGLGGSRGYKNIFAAKTARLASDFYNVKPRELSRVRIKFLYPRDPPHYGENQRPVPIAYHATVTRTGKINPVASKPEPVKKEIIRYPSLSCKPAGCPESSPGF
jgi:hypothetical protein